MIYAEYHEEMTETFIFSLNISSCWIVQMSMVERCAMWNSRYFL